MSDFETRLTEALTSGAEDAPSVDGFAARARTRAKARRRTRSTLIALGAVAVVAVPVSAIAITADGGGGARPAGTEVATDPTVERTYTRHEFKPVEFEGVTVNVPGNWYALDTSSCEFAWTRYAPFGVDPCTYDGPGLAFYGSATFDPASRPGQIVYENGIEGLSSGYVYADEWAVYVQDEGPFGAMNILASVRTNEADWPELFTPMNTEHYEGLAIDVPGGWEEGGLADWCRDEKVPGWIERPSTEVRGEECAPATGYGIRFGVEERDQTTGFVPATGPEYPEGSWVGVAVVPEGSGRPMGAVQIVAPTEGLAQVIGGSFRIDE